MAQVNLKRPHGILVLMSARLEHVFDAAWGLPVSSRLALEAVDVQEVSRTAVPRDVTCTDGLIFIHTLCGASSFVSVFMCANGRRDCLRIARMKAA